MAEWTAPPASETTWAEQQLDVLNALFIVTAQLEAVRRGGAASAAALEQAVARLESALRPDYLGWHAAMAARRHEAPEGPC